MSRVESVENSYKERKDTVAILLNATEDESNDGDLITRNQSDPDDMEEMIRRV